MFANRRRSWGQDPLQFADPAGGAVSPTAAITMASNPAQMPGGPQLSVANRLDAGTSARRPLFGAPMASDLTPSASIQNLTGANGGGMFAAGRRSLPDAAPFSADDGSVSALGASAVPPVDGPALNRNLPKPKPGFNDPGGWGDKISLLAASFMAAGGNPQGAQMVQDRVLGRYRQIQEDQRHAADLARQDQLRQQDRQWQVEDRDAAMNKPQFFNAGNDRVRYDPVSGQSEVVYDAPEDYQTYAATLGLNPGDAGYGNAVQDYVLRGSGPTAQQAKIGLEGIRQGNRLQLRGTPTYQQAHPAAPRPRASAGPRAPSTMGGVVAPILAKMAQGQPLSAGEQQALATYQAGRGGRRGGGGSSAGASMPTVRTPAEARALPPGTRFRTPDGREMVR